MTPPKRKPWFGDSAGTTREFTFPDTGEEMGWIIDRLDNDGRPNLDVRLSVLDYEQYTQARIGFSCGGVKGAITARPDPASGFVLVVAEIGGEEAFRAYMDHPWEEFDLFPPGDETPQREEAPGRMSKHLWWVSLSARAWPVLKPLTGNDWFNAQVPDR
jgi:hypothetical protein